MTYPKRTGYVVTRQGLYTEPMELGRRHVIELEDAIESSSSPAQDFDTVDEAVEDILESLVLDMREALPGGSKQTDAWAQQLTVEQKRAWREILPQERKKLADFLSEAGSHQLTAVQRSIYQQRLQFLDLALRSVIQIDIPRGVRRRVFSKQAVAILNALFSETQV